MSAVAEAQYARWRAPLLWLSLTGFSFGVWSGSALLFFGGLLGNRDLLVEWH